MQIHIAGGGIVGLLAANLLVKHGFSISLCEKNFPLSLEHTDIRVSALTPVSIKILESIDIWNTCKTHPRKISFFEKIKTWETHDAQSLIFDGKEISQFPLGVIIENNFLRGVLWENIRHSITVVAPNSDEENQMQSNAQLVIAADGADSKTRQEAQIKCHIKDYTQSAVIATIETELPHNNIARQRFLPKGPLAFLPLFNAHQCSIVWSQPHAQAQYCMHLDAAAFNSHLQKSFGKELGEMKLMSKRLVFPIRMQQAEKYIKPKLVLTGDAAHTIHPLAGFGVNMGFLDVVSLVKLLVAARSQHRALGGEHTLRKYERERKSENSLMLKIVDCFTNPVLRKIGFTFSRRLDILNHFFIRWMSHHGEKNIVI